MAAPTIEYRPIGVIRTPFTALSGMPIQAAAADGAEGRIELEPELADGLEGLDGFSHLILLYHLDRVGDRPLRVTSFLADVPHGIFATRSPARPNPIGISAVRLLGIEGATLRIADVDMLDGTPLLDIKPYLPAMDDREGARIGWYEGRIERLATTRSDARFGTKPDRTAPEREDR